MTPGQFNRIRSRNARSALAFAFSFFGLSLSAAGKSIPLVFFFGATMLLSGYLTHRRSRQMESFRCPQCGKNPTVWISDDPSDDKSGSDFDTPHCLNCKTPIEGDTRDLR